MDEAALGAVEGVERAARASADRREHTLQRLLPPLVHRLNNALAVAQLVHDLADEASSEERVRAGMGLATVRDTLERLALHTRADPGPERLRGDGDGLFRALELLFRPLANSQRIELELRAQALPASADQRLEALLLDLCVALACGGGALPGAGRRLRLAADVHAGMVRLRLSAVGLRPTPAALSVLTELAALARCGGWSFVSRCRPAALALRFGFPAPGATPQPHPPVCRARAQRVLLLHGAGAVREELAMLLREAGHTVTEASEEPRQGAFDLALLEQAPARDDSELFARLQARLAGRVEWLTPGLPPGEILRRVQV